MLTSIITELGFISETVSSEMTQGVLPFFERKAPMTTSQVFTALFKIVGWIIDVYTRLPRLFWRRLNL
ncbi:hypothetical protein D3C86_2020770 [compost metagenome]